MGVHIKMDTSKENVINVHIKDKNIIHLKACMQFFLQKYLWPKYDH